MGEHLIRVGWLICDSKLSTGPVACKQSPPLTTQGIN
jgi:hypothetical protein